MGGCSPPCSAKRREIEREQAFREAVRDFGAPRRVLSVGDAHFPHQDDDAVGAMLSFAREYAPDIVVVHGDWYDFYDLSRFDKSPKRARNLQDELDAARPSLEALVDSAAPNAEFHFLMGNHEDRLRRYLWSRAPELSHLRALDFRVVTGLADLGFEVREYGDPLALGKLHIVHGDVVRKYAGYSARGMMMKYGTSVAHGHTHRLAATYETRLGGRHVAYELGCLSELNPEYISGVPDWQHGFGAGLVFPSGDFHFQPVYIREGRAFFGSEVFSA